MHKLLSMLAAIMVVCGIVGTGEAAGVFAARLTGAEEVPPVETETFGRARVVFNEEETEAKFLVQLRRGVRITQGHIHCAPAGVNGSVVAFLAGLNPQGYDVDGIFPWISNATLTDTSVIPSDPTSNPTCPDVITDLASLAQAIRNGNAYVNIHSIAHPTGVVRGQLVER